MAKGSRPAGSGGGGATLTVSAQSAQNAEEEFVNEMISALNSTDEVPMSNGDLQGAVEAFAETHPGVDEDALLERIRDGAATKPYMDQIAKAKSEAKLNQIVEDAANAEDRNGNSILTNRQYEQVYRAALTKIQTGQNPTITQTKKRKK